VNPKYDARNKYIHYQYFSGLRYNVHIIDSLTIIYVIFDFYNSLKCYRMFTKFCVPVFNYYKKKSDTLTFKTQFFIRAVYDTVSCFKGGPFSE